MTVHATGTSATEVLSEAFPFALLSKMNFENSIPWNDSGTSFSHLVRCLLCLIDDEIIQFQFSGIKTTNTTRPLMA